MKESLYLCSVLIPDKETDEAEAEPRKPTLVFFMKESLYLCSVLY
jgi:hypothetical protein